MTQLIASYELAIGCESTATSSLLPGPAPGFFFWRTQMNDSILVTSEVLARYKISRSTLYFWSTPERMPSSFSCPFPKPTIPGNPKRWRESEIKSWEDKVNFAKADTQ